MRTNFRREFLISLGIICAVILLYGAVFYLLSLDLQSEAVKVADNKAVIAKRSAAIESLAGLKANSSQAAVYKQAMDKILVTRDELLDFPRWLEGLARGRNVSLSFSFENAQVAAEKNLPGYIGFAVDAGGTLADIHAFIKDVELKSPGFLVGFDNIDLRGGGSSYKAALRGRVFFR